MSVLNRKFQNKKIKIILFFVFLFLVGLHFLPNVNGNFDENTEQHILLSNIKDYAEVLKLDRVANYIHKRGILAISEDPNRDHGIAAYYLFTPLLHNQAQHPHFVSVMWHLYTFCLAFIGVIFFYLLMNYLFKNTKLSLLMTMLYYFTPRIFIDSFHNNKDIVLMSLLVAMIYFGVRLIKEKKIRHAVLFAVFGALVSNIKILGLFFAAIIGIGYILYLTIRKEWSKRNFLCGLIAAICIFAFYLLITPAIWGTGQFKLIEYIQYCTNNAVSFSAPTAVLFEGAIHLHNRNPLPWYYIPKMVLISIPIIISVLFIISIFIYVINSIRGIVKKKFEFNNYVYLLVVIILAVPLTIALTSNPNLYNGWRHFYFLYSLMLIIIGYGINQLIKYNKVKIVIVLILSLTICFDVFCLAKYGIANTAYYNILAGSGDLSHTYELDYYNASSLDALKKFVKTNSFEQNDDGLIYLYASGFGEVVINDMKTYASESISEKLVVLNNDNYKKELDKGKIVYNMSNPVYRYNNVNEYDLVYSYKMFNSEVINFYKMK